MEGEPNVEASRPIRSKLKRVGESQLDLTQPIQSALWKQTGIDMASISEYKSNPSFVLRAIEDVVYEERTVPERERLAPSAPACA